MLLAWASPFKTPLMKETAMIIWVFVYFFCFSNDYDIAIKHPNNKKDQKTSKTY